MTLSHCALAATLATTAFLALPAQAMDEQMLINKEDMKWGDAPPVLPKGAKLAVLNGDPGKPGMFTIRLSAPANYKIAPHWHSQTENLTVISGALYLGVGDKMSPKEARALKAGGYHYLPAKARHFAYTKAPTVIQVSGEGPFDINYINPKDNPMAAKQ
jgi:quercetin dioxygenase-like cupin family protein